MAIVFIGHLSFLNQTKERELSKNYLGRKKNTRSSMMRKKITERLTGGRKWISRRTEIAKEVLKQGWDRHEGPKPEKRITRTILGIPSRRDRTTVREECGQEEASRGTRVATDNQNYPQ